MGWLALLVLSGLAALGRGYLLPADVVPAHYDLQLLYDLDPDTNFSFYGVVDILINPKRPTSRIVLHAQKFNISKDRIRLSSSAESDPVSITRVDLNDTYNFLSLELGRALDVDKDYFLVIPFYGNLDEDVHGVGISDYVDKTTKKKEYIILTHFEAISARKGFPCFHEPLYKATFTITIGHHKNYSAISNMPLSTTTVDNVLDSYWPWSEVQKTYKKNQSNFVWNKFNRSDPMSTYLVAYVVSKFSYVESPPHLSRAKFRIWATKDAVDQMAYASMIGPKVLSHLEEWFNVSFPLPKMDMVAIPDFSAGAGQNWGLITYREMALLFDSSQSSFLDKEPLAETIAHELAHQWFGNLVTMKWWSDLWLNEGFATFVASIGVAAVEPTWQVYENMAVKEMMYILENDALESSHPVAVPLNDPNLISEISDDIAFDKSASIVRMMNKCLGEDVFKRAIHNYLIKYSYNNAEQNDLWSELTKSIVQQGGLSRNVTVEEIMDTWTTQPGYPILTVTRDYSGDNVMITQKRYLLMGGDADTSSSWWVPLNVMSEGDNVTTDIPLQWLASHEGVSSEHRCQHGARSDQWLLFNKDYIAPYRVNYDARNWKLLISALHGANISSIPRLSRVQLISDAFALAWSNRLDYTTALKLALYLQRETEFLPLNMGLTKLAQIDNILLRTTDYRFFQKFVRKLINGKYHKSGGLATKKIINGEDLNSVKMQVRMSSWACRMKVPGCEENAIEMFQQWMETENPDENNPIPLELRPTVYCVALSRGSTFHWHFLLARKQRTNAAAAQRVLLDALTCTKEVWILTQYLEWALTEGSEIQNQDAPRAIVKVARTTVGYFITKNFIYNRIKDISKMVRGKDHLIGRIVDAVVEQFTMQRELDEFMEWRTTHMQYLEGSKLAVDQAIEKAKVNIGWLERNRVHVIEKLREFSADYNDVLKLRSADSAEVLSKASQVLINTNYMYITFWILHTL